MRAFFFFFRPLSAAFFLFFFFAASSFITGFVPGPLAFPSDFSFSSEGSGDCVAGEVAASQDGLSW